jgi:hypothetical protein
MQATSVTVGGSFFGGGIVKVSYKISGLNEQVLSSFVISGNVINVREYRFAYPCYGVTGMLRMVGRMSRIGWYWKGIAYDLRSCDTITRACIKVSSGVRTERKLH